MRIYQIVKRGEYHLDFCEDYSTIQKITEDTYCFAVMDGCTMGKESHFASTLVGKIIRKVLKERTYKLFYGELSETTSLEQTLKQIVAAIFIELKNIKNTLLIETNELLTTIILLILDTSKKNGVAMAIGDAFIAINGKITCFEQDNKPNYLAYHIGKDFEKWFAEQTQILYLQDCQDISIATDGIDSFRIAQGTTTQEIDIPHFLLNDTTFSEKDEMLSMKVKFLENKYALVPTDDLAIIRIMV